MSPGLNENVHPLRGRGAAPGSQVSRPPIGTGDRCGRAWWAWPARAWVMSDGGAGRRLRADCGGACGTRLWRRGRECLSSAWMGVRSHQRNSRRSFSPSRWRFTLGHGPEAGAVRCSGRRQLAVRIRSPAARRSIHDDYADAQGKHGTGCAFSGGADDENRTRTVSLGTGLSPMI